MDEVYKEVETPEGERKLYRIAKARDKFAKDFTQIRQIKDEQGVVICEHDTIIKRWKGYYGKLIKEENPRTVFGDGVPNELTPAIDREKVQVALKGMQHGMAMGPDGIPVEVWKSLGDEGVEQLCCWICSRIFSSRIKARGMEGQCDCANIQSGGGHP